MAMNRQDYPWTIADTLYAQKKLEALQKIQNLGLDLGADDGCFVGGDDELGVVLEEIIPELKQLLVSKVRADKAFVIAIDGDISEKLLKDVAVRSQDEKIALMELMDHCVKADLNLYQRYANQYLNRLSEKLVEARVKALSEPPALNDVALIRSNLPANFNPGATRVDKFLKWLYNH